MLVNRLAISPSSQKRALAIAASSRARASARMGRRSNPSARGPTISRLQVLFCALVRLPERFQDDGLDLGGRHARRSINPMHSGVSGFVFP
jgi:hypothetical protein